MSIDIYRTEDHGASFRGNQTTTPTTNAILFGTGSMGTSSTQGNVELGGDS